MTKTKKQRRSRFAVLAVVALAAACATAGGYVPRAEELASSPEEAAGLARGRAAYIRECAACHRMYWPEEYPPARWEAIAPPMGERAGLGEETIDELTRFLVGASRRVRGE